MTGLDCNVLVQLAFADHPVNRETIAVIENEVERGAHFVFPPLIATEFLHVATDDRRFSPPLSMTEALQWIDDFTSSSAISLLQPTSESWRQTLKWMRELRLGRKRILDTHLAAVLYTSGVRRLLTSNPADFKIFEVLELVVI